VKQTIRGIPGTGLVALALILVMLSGLVSGCKSTTDTTGPSGSESFPMTVTDDRGRVVTIDKAPQRIVSLAPSNTEILFALGLGDRVVAVSDFSDYPSQAKEKPNVGVYPAPNMEQLVDLSTDLVLAAEIQTGEVILQLEERGFPVFVLAPQTIDELLESIALVGEITGQRGEASQLVAEMQDRINAVTEQTDSLPQGQRPRVFYIVWHDPLMAPGSGTFQDDLIRKAGGINIARDIDGWATISLEAVIQANPEVMIASVSYSSDDTLTFQYIQTELRLSDADARQNDRVYGIDGDIISRAGPRVIQALELLARMIHPEIFGSPE
jgi:iron complex transport system substrate-binding protein